MIKVVRLAAVAALVSSPLLAGGAWVPKPGDGTSQLGYSRKTAHTSWDVNGNSYNNGGCCKNHDFRYFYNAGEVGVVDGLSVTWLITWLDGREGPDGNIHKDSGFSDAWFGAKYGWGESSRPFAVALSVRTPVLYDQNGPYTRNLYDSQGNFLTQSPEWRGVLKHDVTTSFLHSRSIAGGRGWVSGELGYTWREGAPADQVPLALDGGWTLPWGDIVAKGSVLFIRSLGNDSPKEPDDRFGSSAIQNFNDASMGRVGLGLMRSFGAEKQWTVEAGYNIWVWGRSARQYEEPFFGVTRSF